MTWRNIHNSELYISGIIRTLLKIDKIIELFICRPDPELKVLPQEPFINPVTKLIY